MKHETFPAILRLHKGSVGVKNAKPCKNSTHTEFLGAMTPSPSLCAALIHVHYAAWYDLEATAPAGGISQVVTMASFKQQRAFNTLRQVVTRDKT